MNSISEPIVRRIKDTEDSLNELVQELNMGELEEKEYLINYPILYIHNWKINNKDSYEVYVGEANDVIQRTKQHYNKMEEENYWSSKIKNNKEAYLYIIGHEHFNKSMTLSLENKMMHYLTSVKSVSQVCNKRGNEQRHFYPYKEFDSIFSMIWSKLNKENSTLFPSENEIKDSVIFKASPFHVLTEEQFNAKNAIMNSIEKALKNKNIEHQLIMVEGSAGTGKTVLTNSIFYDLLVGRENSDENDYEMLGNKNLKCALIVNHDEQKNAYQQIAKKLGIDSNVVFKSTEFINKYSDIKTNSKRQMQEFHPTKEVADVVFIDESHLLYTQKNQSYQGDIKNGIAVSESVNQLDDIINRARVTVIMFDKSQIIRRDEYVEESQIEKMRKRAVENIKLENQLRMKVNDSLKGWLDSFIKDGKVKLLPDDMGNYEIKAFDSIKELDNAIIEKAKNEKTKLSRLIASYDWDWKPQQNSNGYWEVTIDDGDEKWHKPWNYEIRKYDKEKVNKKEANDSWAEQSHTINEVGSTYTIQGFDLNYAGVIFGPSIKYIDGKIKFDKTESKNDKVNKDRTLMENGKKVKKDVSEELLKNELNILMSRGANGLYIYACDEALRKALILATEGRNNIKLLNKYTLTDDDMIIIK